MDFLNFNSIMSFRILPLGELYEPGGKNGVGTARMFNENKK